jgi:HSP20 family protein
VPGVSREPLTISIAGHVIHIETARSQRPYKAAYELPQDIDVSKSED